MERRLVAAVSAGFALPLLAAPYVPGGDTPWHAAVVAVLAEGDGAYLEAGDGGGSYAVVYRALAWLARLVGAPAAVQILVVLSVVGFVWAARRLALAFGRSGVVALVAAPAACSSTLEFGYLIYLPSLPLTLFMWALVRELMAGQAPRLRAPLLAATWLAIGLCHPFAAAIAGAGGGLLVAIDLDRRAWRRAALCAGLLALGAIPAIISLAAVSQEATARIPGLEEAPLWNRLTTQVFVDPGESLARAPERLFGFMAIPIRTLVFAAGLLLVLVWRRMAGGPRASRAPIALAALLLVFYLVTPFTFEWPRNWYGAQPRILPLLWVVGLVALAPTARTRWIDPAAATFAALALSAIVVAAIPMAAEARDLARVIDRGADGGLTLGLIEQPRTEERRPPHPLRNATGWVVAERGGFASHLPMGNRSGLNSGQHIPVRLAEGAIPPPAPPLGFPRAFRWERHAASWDQFLIRDGDPAHPHAYFAGHEAEIELVARSGRWRLYRRVPPR